MTEAPFVSPRRPEGVEARPMGWWGTLLLAAVLATTYAALCFTYVYVRVASADWPPSGIDPPALGLPGLSAVALAASLAPLWWALRGERDRSLASFRLGMIATVGLGIGHVALLLVDWAAQPFTVDGHAYGSLYYVLPGLHVVILGIGLLMALVLLALSWQAGAGSLVHVGTRSLVLYWSVTVAGGVVLLAFVYLIPHLWQEAIVTG